MADPDVIYKIALSMLRHMKADIVREMADRGMEPKEFFSLETPVLSGSLGLSGGLRFEKMERDEALFNARREYDNMQRHHVEGCFILDPDYPVRLFNIPDAPVFIYKLGGADLDSEHVVSIVGTRRPTAYGMDFCNKLVADLAAYFPDLLVVSGIAYGIDAAGHQAALAAGVKTAAVVAHGLNQIYPARHRDLAKTIIKNGGAIVSEYPFGSQPYRQRFLERNRIVAGLADVTVVVESAVKGGAMSTANTAFSYSRDVMALPGRISDENSSGCNLLIRKNKAHMITGAADLVELTGWQPLILKLTPHKETCSRNLRAIQDLSMRLSDSVMNLCRLIVCIC